MKYYCLKNAVFLEVLATITQQNKTNTMTTKQKNHKRHIVWKGRNETISTCRLPDYSCRKSQSMKKRKAPRISEFSKVSGYEVGIQISTVLLYTHDEQLEFEILKRIHL